MRAIKTISASDIHLKKRKSSSHKGDNGRVLIIGGSKEYVGAAALAGLAALRSGCDWVTIAAPQKVAWAINCLTPDLITVKLDGDYLSIKHIMQLSRLIQKHDVILIGNGIGLSSDTKNLVKALIKKWAGKKPMVVDADALKMISLYDIRDAILTPHHSELNTLLANSGIKKDLSESGLKIIQPRLQNNVLLIKGPTDYIVSSSRIVKNIVHHPAMTVAGTGDVLAGLCAGFLAQGYLLFESACYGAYFNGLTGKMLARKKRYQSLIASDIVWDVAGIIRKMRRVKDLYSRKEKIK